MAGTINYLYDPNQVVQTIVEGEDGCLSVRKGMVIRVNVSVLVTKTELTYDVQLDGQSGTVELVEADVFDTLSAAVDQYEIRLGGTPVTSTP